MFLKDVKKTNWLDSYGIFPKGKNVFGYWCSVREPKNKTEFKKKATKMRNSKGDENFEFVALISDNWCAFKYDYEFYSVGEYFVAKENVKKDREEI